MSFTISPSKDGKYISLKITGDIDSKIAMNNNIEAHALGKKLGINRYFVDLTKSRNVESVADSYKFAYEDMKTPMIDKSARVAILVDPNDHSHDFIETVLQNSGHSVKLFTDRKLAKSYLLKE